MARETPLLRHQISVGARFRVLQPLPAFLFTHWRLPYTGGHEVTLSAPLDLVVEEPPAEDATSIRCRPEPYLAFHRRHVPWWERWRPGYAGFSLLVKVGDLLAATQPVRP
jgi:hypothetical protein